VGAAGVVVAPKAEKASEPAPKAEKSPEPAKKSKAAAPKKAEKAPAPAETAAEAPGARPSNLLEAPRDGQADDLKKLSGVGPKLETLLHENGVYHFDQIAAWTGAEVEWMDAQLSFKGRITRENWIEQAQALAAEKE
jgi:large subunit ribosomal protein L21